MAKNLVLSLILAPDPNSALQKNFSKIWFQSLDIMASYHHVQYPKKLMIQSRKVSDGRTDRQTDGQADEINFIGRCPTNVERPISFTV